MSPTLSPFLLSTAAGTCSYKDMTIHGFDIGKDRQIRVKAINNHDRDRHERQPGAPEGHVKPIPPSITVVCTTSGNSMERPRREDAS